MSSMDEILKKVKTTQKTTLSSDKNRHSLQHNTFISKPLE